MGTTPQGKTQLNVYVYDSIDEFIELVSASIENFGKSDFVHLAFSYFRQNFTIEDIEKMYADMLFKGEKGLRQRHTKEEAVA